MQDTNQEDQVMNPTLKISEAFVKSKSADCCIPEQQDMQLTRDGTPTPEKAENDCSTKRKREWDEEKRDLKKFQVSKPLLDCLWAQFKLKNRVKRRDIKALSFEFDLTYAQIQKWFRKNRNKFGKEMFGARKDGQNK
ncbi:NANOG neighbor homeobox isoform X1 [Sminthopsis crassicaudata]|uniref:NANOG neighbor homeobox isoform X1 n=1 Tax=Sminthopsis crassicaudata TaxID=9301 RepID=UPI003D696C43